MILTILHTRVPFRTSLLSISQPYEVALLGEPAEADTQTLINTVYAAYLPNKVVAGCARTTRKMRNSYPFWRIAPRAMAG
jgi:hypothetical protein